MTMPHRMNCPHADSGWCAACVAKMGEELGTAKQDIAKLVAVARKHGWNGVENSKTLAQFFADALSVPSPAKGGANSLPAQEGVTYTANGVRHLPQVAYRVETGPVKFGDDWAGVFIRGDDSANYLMSLAVAASKIEDPMAKMTLSGLQRLLGEAIVGPTGVLLPDGVFTAAPEPHLHVVRTSTKTGNEESQS